MTHITIERAKLEQALEALEETSVNPLDYKLDSDYQAVKQRRHTAITAIKQARSAPVRDGVWKAEQKALAQEALECATEALSDPNNQAMKAVREYYGAAQPAPVPPVSQAIIHAITEYGDARADQDANNAPTTSHERLADCIRLIRDALPPPAQPAPAQEPVAWRCPQCTARDIQPCLHSSKWRTETTPPAAQPAVPLTEKELRKMHREVEKAHGITEKGQS